MKNRIKLFIIILMLCVATVFPCGANAGVPDVAGIRGGAHSLHNLKSELATKAPVGKRALALKFLLAMVGVAASSVVIYVGLSFYNRFMFGKKRVVLDEMDNDFQTPTNMKDAINIFLKKTK